MSTYMTKPMETIHLQFTNSQNQHDVVQALLDNSNHIQNAADSLSLTKRQIIKTATRVRDNAARQGYSPEHNMFHPAPESHFVKGTSTLYDDEGNIKQQWVKTDKRKEDAKEVLDFLIECMQETTIERNTVVSCLKRPNEYHDDLLTVYPMGDPHIGMFSWAEETGVDFDLEIAREEITTAMTRLVQTAPASRTALIANLGDFFHADDSSNMTKRSGNILDVDTRWAKVLRTGVDAMITMIELALRKHEEVNVINEIGNHDDSTSYVLSIVLDAYFKDEPRVTIDLSPMTFHYHQFGDVLIGITHGDKIKYADLGPIMATDKAKEWGDTNYRYWYVGHVHHHSSKEFHGCSVESFRNLAPNDAWHAGKGYRSGKDMKCIVHHKSFGEVERHTVNIDMIKKDIEDRSAA